MSDITYSTPAYHEPEDFSAENPAEPISPDHPDYENDQLFVRLDNIETQLRKLTDAVNSFGTSMQFIVDQVSNFGQSFAKGGIGGIMSLMGGKNNG